jgi:hypothetical protein
MASEYSLMCAPYFLKFPIEKLVPRFILSMLQGCVCLIMDAFPQTRVLEGESAFLSLLIFLC